MTNNPYAKELEAQAMMYPQGDVFDALGADHVTYHGVTIKPFCTCKLGEHNGIERGTLRH